MPSYSELDFPGTISTSSYVGYDTGQKNFNQNLNPNFTHMFTPNVVSSTKIDYNRFESTAAVGHRSFDAWLVQHRLSSQPARNRNEEFDAVGGTTGSNGTNLHDIGNVNTQDFGSAYERDTNLGNRLNYQ